MTSQMTGGRLLDASLLKSQDVFGNQNESEYINVESANVTLNNLAESTINADAPIAEVSEEDQANSVRSQSLNQQ